jgi:hypothetical protein
MSSPRRGDSGRGAGRAQRDDPLLGAVMDIAFQAPALAVGGRDDARAAGPQLGKLRAHLDLEALVLQRRTRRAATSATSSVSSSPRRPPRRDRGGSRGAGARRRFRRRRATHRRSCGKGARAAARGVRGRARCARRKRSRSSRATSGERFTSIRQLSPRDARRLDAVDHPQARADVTAPRTPQDAAGRAACADA